jgi:Asp-tRNA(Asn)/Glu-tRNA(Gln) amidotransferase C subunit
MKAFYLMGVLAAFLVGLVKVVSAVIALLSLRTRNMRQVGMYYSCLNSAYTADVPSAWKFVGYVLFMLVLAPVASWLSVTSAAWTWLRWRAGQQATPEDVKRLQYRLAHVRLSKEQMIEWQEELSKVLGVAGPVRTGDAQTSTPLVLVLEPGEWYSELRMHPDKRMMEFYGHSPDYDSIFHSTYEYRFDDNVLEARLLDDHTDHPGQQAWSVRDGVVLEAELRMRAAKTSFAAEVDERINSLRQEVGWHPYRNARIRYFVMRMHPSLFSHAMIAELVRGDIQRAGALAERAAAEARKNKLEVVENGDGVEFKFEATLTNEERERARNELTKSLAELGVSFDELRTFKKQKAELLDTLR